MNSVGWKGELERIAHAPLLLKKLGIRPRLCRINLPHPGFPDTTVCLAVGVPSKALPDALADNNTPFHFRHIIFKGNGYASAISQ
jgi:hypothetical protein